MEGFKNSTKIKYFKEGGFVTKKEFTSYEKKEDKSEEGKDTKKDIQIVKKGVRQHESALHKGEPKTELTLKQGGRAKKSVGTVNKYKSGGEVTNVYEAKKSSGDKDNIRKVKDIAPVKLCGGKSVKKYAPGGGVLDKIAGAAKDLKEKVMGTPEQNRLALEREKRIAARKAAEASGSPAAIAAQPSPTAPLPAAPGINVGAGNPEAGAPDAAIPGGQKKGGKVKKDCK